MTKKIGVYGSYVTKMPVKQRYWKRRRDGIRQRYWKKTKRMRKVAVSGRYEFHGKGRDLYKAIVTAHRLMPKDRFVDVSAREFLEHPERYGQEGSWIDREVES